MNTYPNDEKPYSEEEVARARALIPEDEIGEATNFCYGTQVVYVENVVLLLCAALRTASQPSTPASASEAEEPMTADLLPCPFCGKSNQDRWPCEWLDGSGANVIRCAWCHGAAPMDVWNRRHPIPASGEGEQDKLRAALAKCVAGAKDLVIRLDAVTRDRDEKDVRHFEEFTAMRRDRDSWKERAALATQDAAGVPDGYVLVPREPTEAMMRAASECVPYPSLRDRWCAMIAAAPPADG